MGRKRLCALVLMALLTLDGSSPALARSVKKSISVSVRVPARFDAFISPADKKLTLQSNLKERSLSESFRTVEGRRVKVLTLTAV